MKKEELIKQANRIKSLRGKVSITAFQLEASEFLKTYGGKDNQFYKELSRQFGSWDHLEDIVDSALESFIRYVENDLLRTISLQREIQIDTVSDYLEQAEKLLNDNKFHPGAATVIIGASLEEFCRNWLEEEGINLSNIKSTLDSYSKELRTKNLISKQDAKDITSWGGLRNSAAHGKWEEVENRELIKLMLQGVNLFMRKYGQTN